MFTFATEDGTNHGDALKVHLARNRGLLAHNDSEHSGIELDSAVISEKVEAKYAVNAPHDRTDEDLKVGNGLALDLQVAKGAASWLIYR